MNTPVVKILVSLSILPSFFYLLEKLVQAKKMLLKRGWESAPFLYITDFGILLFFLYSISTMFGIYYLNRSECSKWL